MRRVRQILIKILDDKEREAMAGIPGSVIVASFQTAGYKPTSEIVAANRLKGGDILLQTTSIRAREELERDQS